MEQQDHHDRRRYIQSHWPAFLWAYGIMVAGVLLAGISLIRHWYSFVPFALLLTLAGGYYLFTAFWYVRRLHGATGRVTADTLFAYSQAQAYDRLVCIDLGLRNTALSLARHLTAGHITVIDVYHPDSNKSAALRRARAHTTRPKPDPRLTWIDGSIDLLPLPDEDVRAVFLSEVLSEFWLVEERMRLLAEVHRILVPYGRLLLSEQVRTQGNLVVTGPITITKPTAGYWRKLLTDAGFSIQREELLHGIIYCVRADKPPPTAAQQLALGLEYV